MGMQQIQADAWDEGYRAHKFESNLRSAWQLSDSSDPMPKITNPYRSEPTA